MGFAGGWFGTSPRRSRILIDGASVQEGLRRATHPKFEAEFSSIHRSTSTSTTASSEDALASILRSQVACV